MMPQSNYIYCVGRLARSVKKELFCTKKERNRIREKRSYPTVKGSRMRDNTSNHTEGSAVREKNKPDHRQTEAQREKRLVLQSDSGNTVIEIKRTVHTVRQREAESVEGKKGPILQSGREKQSGRKGLCTKEVELKARKM